jgi:phosphopantothenoylcysteine decarboxylase/phosphopantothenate--cysteine ligase
MDPVANKRVLLGVTGGIAAYKAAELARRLMAAGAEVQVVMTRAATAFVAPLTFQALSGRIVRTELFDPGQESAMGHIELARWADLILVAPATADFLARLAHGLADDLLTTLCLASAAPLVLAPAMNQQMWRAPATAENCAVLQRRGAVLLGPGQGEQACGEVGPGRMLEPASLVEALRPLLGARSLEGLRVLVTAGPTREPIDPVRFLTNRSSGRMGYAVAQAAAEGGARVSLVSGPVALAAPTQVTRVMVETAREMRQAVLDQAGSCDVFIATAAVADYRPVVTAAHKIKKDRERLTLELERNPDILAEVAALPRAPFTVGFAAETEDVAANAREKLVRKGLDLVAANRVGESGLGFDAQENALVAYWRGGETDLGRAPKLDLARRLVRLIDERYRETRGSAQAS